VENRVCLSRSMLLAGAAWWAVTRIVTEVGDLMQRNRDGRTGRLLSDRMIGRSGDTVCGLYGAHEDENRGFLD
jgi:hypothetical protein